MTDQLALFSKEPKPQTRGMTFEQQFSFDKFWGYFGYKFGKVAAQRAWVKQWKHIKLILDRVYRAALMTATERAKLTHTPKMAQGWINDHTWVDERFDKYEIEKHTADWNEDDWRKHLGPKPSGWYLKYCDNHYKLPDVIRKENGFTR